MDMPSSNPKNATVFLIPAFVRYILNNRVAIVLVHLLNLTRQARKPILHPHAPTLQKANANVPTSQLNMYAAAAYSQYDLCVTVLTDLCIVCM